MEIANPVGDALHGLHRRDDDALNERPAVGRPPQRTPAVKSSPLQFSGFQLFQAATSAQSAVRLSFDFSA
jgi:hypothetical protein